MDFNLGLIIYFVIGFCIFLLVVAKDCLLGIKRKVDSSDVFLTLAICVIAWPFVFVHTVCEIIATLINRVNNK